MRRITVTIDDELVEIARAAVKAGRAPSVSAWVAAAMREKASAIADVLSDIEDSRRKSPPTPETIQLLAKVLKRPESWVSERLGLQKPRSRRAG